MKYNTCCNIFRGYENTWIGVREQDGSDNDPTSVTFTDGTTPVYVPPMSLDDGDPCLRFINGGLSDRGCGYEYNFLCKSDLIVQGKLMAARSIRSIKWMKDPVGMIHKLTYGWCYSVTF